MFICYAMSLFFMFTLYFLCFVIISNNIFLTRILQLSKALGYSILYQNSGLILFDCTFSPCTGYKPSHLSFNKMLGFEGPAVN